MSAPALTVRSIDISVHLGCHCLSGRAATSKGCLGTERVRSTIYPARDLLLIREVIHDVYGVHTHAVAIACPNAKVNYADVLITHPCRQRSPVNHA